MEETREGAGQKQERAEEPPRKAPRLDLLVAAAAATDSGRGEAVAPPEVSNLREEGAEGTSDNKQCNHVPTDSAHLKMLSSSVFSEHAGRCELCKHLIEGTSILVCLECGRHFCSGVGSVEYPFGHSRRHAQEEEHWVAALSENPKSAFCFKCDCVMDGPHVITGLLAAAEGDSESSDGPLVQCFLVLDKLRARMLGPDAPKGHFAKALTDLFVGATAAESLLDPHILLTCVRWYKQGFEGSKMHDSHDLLMSLLNGLKEDSSEVQHICQSKDVVQGHLQTQEDKVTCPEPELSQRITEVPVQSASLLPLSMSVKVEEMNETTADSVASIEDCLSLFHGEVVNWRCDNCFKVYMELSTDQSEMDEQIVTSAKDTTTIDGDQAEQSDRTKCKNDQSSGSNSLSVESKFLSSRQLHGSDAEDQNMQTVDRVTGGTNLGQHGEDVSIQKMYQERKKQTEPDHSAYQLEDNRNEQKDGNAYATKTRRFIKLPAVLTLHLQRSSTGSVKISDHVRYKEYLDVEPFTDPSSMVKNTIYRLVGVVEHIGTVSVEEGHYVAYVRARRLGNPEQQGICSHSWFRADDSTISEVSLEDVLKRQAYILFYERIEL
ncbi:hypothetical protein QOZ80_8AG0639200 [Eleusine coracana subsp. coracana]|nr:hypothetical protein QOZ80_8AG0639200 [Eleusine coracana subsp. coracana]